ncbi:vacuolar protein sorting-associated protein 16 homolog isoform X1 [Rana temporaria]|uniref:vacuolar protein sorting-associated protein 16 homolog isoform X1 n=2 Tax=Rana temporaria TaxID=8407 RepID=UPI001AACFACB|nr:vacuolar protein sorting-associated protein 16 homolog isoform X1 [Rana temporaria]
MDFCTANWYPLGDVYYRKFELYQMEWNVREEFKDCLVAVGPYGGSIALMKNYLTKEKPSSSRPILETYSASGVLLATIPWKSGQVVHLGWTVSEDLMCIQEDGTVLIYDIFCVYKRSFSLGNEIKQNQILEAKVFHSEYRTGIAVLTGALNFTLTSNIDDVKLRRMPEMPNPKVLPSCWTILFQDRITLILLAIGNDLYLLDNTACSLVTLPGMSPMCGAYLNFSVSFHHKYLAVFTDSGYIWMGMSSLKEKLWEFTSDTRQAPKQMAWCIRPQSKQIAVVVMWDKMLLVAGKGNDGIQFSLDEETFMVLELDGVRLISHSTHEFLHEIPKATEEIFKIASMAPGALLMEAQKEYEKQSQKADDYLREIKDQNLLPVAVAKCIEAAGYEYAPEMQKSLLRAASFGKCFLDSYSPSDFVTICRDLRVLNAINDYQIGIPLSITQYKQLTIPVLLDRLVLRRLYPLAVKICEHLKQPDSQGVSRILAHWACYKVQQKEKTDEEVAQAINQKLGDAAGISYSEIASKACDCGRTELAIKLLEYEPKSEDQVPLLLKMKRSNLALGKAIESGDTDLVYTVVSYMKHEFNRGDFFMTLQNHPVALSLYQQFCKHQEPETLKDLYNQDDNHQELANFHVRASYSTEKSVEGRVAELQNAVDEYNRAKNDWAAKVTEDQIKLLRIQRVLREQLNKPYLNYSLHETVYNLILDNMQKKAEQLYKEFKIPEKRYWWLKLTALAEKNDWDELENFSKSKKSPIGYLPFVEICMKEKNKSEAKKYIARVNPEQRVKALLLTGDLEQAAEAAIEHKNENEMNMVLSKCNSAADSVAAEKIERAKVLLLKK